MASTLLTGARIRTARTAAGLTLRDLAARTGLSAQYISDLEHDRRSLPDATARRIAQALDIREPVTKDDLIAELTEALTLAQRERDTAYATAKGWKAMAVSTSGTP